MSLTVPVAGSIAGASASVRVATPDTGDVIGAFGAKMADLARGWKADALQMQNTRAQLNITRDLGQARLDVEQLGDPAQIGPAWDAKVAEITGRYITPDTDPELAASLQLSLQEMKDRHGFALGEKVINLNRSQQEAGWIEARNDITTQAVTADPETFGALLEVGEAAIDARAQRGLIDPATAAAEKLALREEVYLGRANAQIESDPAGFLTSADAGEQDGLGGNLAGRRLAAQQELARREAEGARAGELAAKARTDAIGKRLVEMTSIVGQGFNSANEKWAEDPEVQAHPAYAEYAAARKLRDELPGIRQMTVLELDAVIAARKAKPITFAYQTEELKVLISWRDQIAGDYNTAAVETAIKAGLPVPALPTFNPADPQTFAQGLSERLSFDASVRAEGRTKGQAVFTAADKTALAPILDPKADTGPKIALAEAIIAGSGKDAQRITALLGADPVFARATLVMAQTGDRGLAETMLRGQQKIELKTVTLPSDPQMTRVFDEISGGAFQTTGLPAGQADAVVRLRNQVAISARAIYADSASSVDPEAQSGADWSDSDEAQSLYADAVKRALGATSDRTGSLNIGGLADINGGYVSLPPGVPVEDAQAAHETIRRQIMGYEDQSTVDTFVPGLGMPAPEGSSDPAPGPKAQDPLRALLAASVGGLPPELGDEALDRWEKIQFRRVGQSDQYELFYVEDGRTYTVPQADDPKRRAYRFRLPDLIREGQRQ